MFIITTCTDEDKAAETSQTIEVKDYEIKPIVDEIMKNIWNYDAIYIRRKDKKKSFEDLEA